MQEGNQILAFIIFSSALIVLIVVLVLAFLISYQKKIVLQKLHIEQAEVEHRQKLLNATIEVQEKERKRIASDLHDDIGSLLSTMKLNLNYLKKAKVEEEREKVLNQTFDMVKDGLANVRRISYDLLPPTLARLGLWEALKELANRLNDSEQISISLTINGTEHSRLSEPEELAIFRVVQELISNTLHHSNAKHIVLEIGASTGTLSMEYRDNGLGFTNEKQIGGLGMTNMQSRIRAINGSMQVSDESTGHFFARITLPLNANNEH